MNPEHIIIKLLIGTTKVKSMDFLNLFCSWAILFSHPADFTPVCTTELGRVMQLNDEFVKRGVKVIALSCNTIDEHNGWSQVSMQMKEPNKRDCKKVFHNAM